MTQQDLPFLDNEGHVWIADYGSTQTTWIPADNTNSVSYTITKEVHSFRIPRSEGLGPLFSSLSISSSAVTHPRVGRCLYHIYGSVVHSTIYCRDTKRLLRDFRSRLCRQPSRGPDHPLPCAIMDPPLTWQNRIHCTVYKVWCFRFCGSNR